MCGRRGRSPSRKGDEEENEEEEGSCSGGGGGADADVGWDACADAAAADTASLIGPASFLRSSRGGGRGGERAPKKPVVVDVVAAAVLVVVAAARCGTDGSSRTRRPSRSS